MVCLLYCKHAVSGLFSCDVINCFMHNCFYSFLYRAVSVYGARIDKIHRMGYYIYKHMKILDRQSGFCAWSYIKMNRKGVIIMSMNKKR